MNEKASRDIKASVASDHIFDKDNLDLEGYRTEENDNDECSEALNNPFRKLGLDLKIVKAITSPDGYFKLSQPTIVQSQAVKALLPSNVGSMKGGICRDNLFIQSETGSGKTLAYLLPILQVSIHQHNVHLISLKHFH